MNGLQKITSYHATKTFHYKQHEVLHMRLTECLVLNDASTNPKLLILEMLKHDNTKLLKVLYTLHKSITQFWVREAQ